ncbi:hypothetical protein EKO23_21295 [Nocardioides guangzhouensis]|uniref:DUF4352 domain-containing protein n=1 Tax=Nocardioides guangzhouensis TaxID=2497878 RepID=A0A4Q4Z6N8_9ACTN|nr:TasA family protein [Nocardioides guangzhouensis]RYP82624.1 hypothetical protein EKO23_21295 [Nocardioides guangzhouensis]
MKTTDNRRRKVLVPLATLLAATAVAIGSGATFTSTSNSASAVTAGDLVHSNDRADLTMDVANIKPGDSVAGTVTIENTGTIDSTLTLQETADSSTFQAGALHLEVTQGATTVYDGDFAAADDAGVMDLGALDIGDSTTLKFTVSMPSNASDANQGATASASYQWVSTQVEPSSTTLAWH